MVYAAPTVCHHIYTDDYAPWRHHSRDIVHGGRLSGEKPPLDHIQIGLATSVDDMSNKYTDVWGISVN